MKNRFLWLIFIGLFANFPLFSQQVEFEKSDQWKFLLTTGNVNFFYKVAACHDDANSIHSEYVLLKLENISDQPIEISWDVLMYYNNKCWNCNNLGPEYHKVVQLDPGQTIEGKCFDKDKTLRIFSKFLDYKDRPESTLTNFKLINLQTKTLK